MFPGLDFAGNERFRVIRRIGEGGMGIVYEAEDVEDGRRLALKVIRRGHHEEIYRLKREFRALADISHPNLVDVYDLGGEGHLLFVTMELVSGATFTDHCRGDRPAATLGDERRIRAALAQLVHGLGALHDAGMVHRDVKPSNVLVTESGRVVVLDLGLVAGSTERSDSLDGKIVGSVAYMAPEQAAGETVTPAADWYALGSMLFEALTGQPPFSGTFMETLLAKQAHPAPPPRAVVPDVAEDLDDLCTALLAREPKRRPTLPEILVRLGASPRVPHVATSQVHSITSLVPFCGRDTELEQLRGCADRVTGGAPVVAYVRGASGIGKSALIARFVREMRGDFVALQGRCYEREMVPYKAMDAIIDELSRFWSQLPDDAAAALVPPNATLLPRLFPVLGRIPAVMNAPAAGAVVDPQELRTRAFAALREVFVRLARVQPVVLVLDDMQWIDDDSVTLLIDLMRPPDPPPILVLLTSRDSSDRARRARTASPVRPPARDAEVPGIERLLATLADHERIELGPLTGDDARQLAVGLLGDERAELADAVVAEAGGSPFFLAELSRYLHDSPDVDRASIDDVLRERIARLPERGAELLELLSVAGDPLSPRVVQSALGCAPEELARLVRYMRTSQMVRAPGTAGDAIEPYHDRLREHVLDGLAGQRRRQLHRDLAIALERWDAGGPEQRARHWYAAGDRDRAAGYAREAADQALRLVDFARAARLYRLALDAETLSVAERREIQTALGIALSASGRALEAAEVLLRAAEGADAATALDLRQRSAEALLLGGYIREGLAAVAEVLDQLDMRLARSPRTALAALLWLRAWLRIRGLGWKRRDASEIPQRALTEVDARYTVASLLSVVDNIRATEFQARHLLSALRSGEPERVSRAIGVEAGFLAAFGHARRATELADLSDEIAESVESATLPPPPFAEWARGAAEYFARNDWAAARELFRAAEMKVRSYGRSGWELDTTQLYGAFSLMYLGEVGELVTRVPGLLREAERRGDLYMVTNLKTRLNIIWLAADDPQRARREIEDAMRRWVPEEQAFHVQHWFALMGRCELALYEGDDEAVETSTAMALPRLRASLLTRVPLVAAEALYLEARAALACADADRQRARYLRVAARCARRLRKCPLRLARQMASVVSAGAAIVAGDDDAAALTEEAVALLEGGSMHLFAQSVRRRLGVLRGGAEGAALIDTADAWMRGQRIANPAAMTRMVIGISE